jgi:hypothetical protein
MGTSCWRAAGERGVARGEYIKTGIIDRWILAKTASRKAAVRSLVDGLGKGMDTWLVTRKPIGLIEGQTDAEHVSPRCSLRLLTI